MKKILIGLLIAVISLSTLCACSNDGAFFSKKILQDNLVPDLPQITYSEAKKEYDNFYRYKTTQEEFNAYVTEVYEYLKSLDFVYFGTRGEELSNFFGGAPTYAFEEASELSDFKYTTDRYGKELENCYVFVWANEILSDKPNLRSYHFELSYYSSDNEYNVILLLNFGFETYHLDND